MKIRAFRYLWIIDYDFSFSEWKNSHWLILTIKIFALLVDFRIDSSWTETIGHVSGLHGQLDHEFQCWNVLPHNAKRNRCLLFCHFRHGHWYSIRPIVLFTSRNQTELSSVLDSVKSRSIKYEMKPETLTSEDVNLIIFMITSSAMNWWKSDYN